ncbi:ferredoxin [Nocardia huaxiensis]|uniref:ferredoxin n=1 Tax=Nocardia huaxiensis TaxID=2755382 RepID=UPI001E627BDF|nr:ferredoxin [Nocardia huaxiensis]UFS98552.1 ferredoxin [Nocardia huaxiensis]
MRLEPETGRCEGHGICVATAPSLLDLDDDGYVTPLGDTISDAEARVARLAVDSCPVQALRLITDSKNEAIR